MKPLMRDTGNEVPIEVKDQRPAHEDADHDQCLLDWNDFELPGHLLTFDEGAKQDRRAHQVQYPVKPPGHPEMLKMGPRRVKAVFHVHHQIRKMGVPLSMVRL